ncbi:hypothetical protein Fsol_00017 [Candidatus Fokinia solitaria]|uniref:Uncharacterized protein n=1 Tax=Candidatus Fokinia solitaria TaxID=1802984 RepID=A0A2U8BR75_9RICK|nr:hypothetical protein [Candidatus Fokinia solitaria]AWD32833.1 hypothetical protein Fsol_00017 [Candidatus Fokinia solitaria]
MCTRYIVLLICGIAINVITLHKEGHAANYVNSIGVSYSKIKSANSEVVTFDYDRIHYLQTIGKFFSYASGGVGAGLCNISSKKVKISWILSTPFSYGYMKKLEEFSVGGYGTITAHHVEYSINSTRRSRTNKAQAISVSAGIKFDYKNILSTQLSYTLFSNAGMNEGLHNDISEDDEVHLAQGDRMAPTQQNMNDEMWDEKNANNILKLVMPSLSLKISFLF